MASPVFFIKKKDGKLSVTILTGRTPDSAVMTTRAGK
jgi:hypothetical protein